MDTEDARDLLVNAMGILATEAEMEATIAEANGMARNEYNRLLEEGLELPEYIKEYRERNKQRQLFEERLVKHELKEKGELLTKPKLLVVFALYPQFEKDYGLLKKHGYFTETELGLKWLKSNQSLAEYFARNCKHKDNVKWKELENLFDMSNLKNSYSSNGGDRKPSKDYAALLTILKK